MKINYSFGSDIFEFDVFDFICENETELILIGLDHQFNNIAAVGVLQWADSMMLYEIKQQTQKHYINITQKKDGDTVSLKSDITTNMWTEKEFIKKDVIPAGLHYFLTDGVLDMIIKNPKGYMVKNGDYTEFMGVKSELYDLLEDPHKPRY